MGNGLPVSGVINVTVNLTPAAAQMANLNTLLIAGASDIIDVNSRWRSYSSATAVATDFGTTAPEYLAAVNYFGQSPQPTELYIGRWAKTATSGRLIGGVLSTSAQALATWTAVTAGAFYIMVDGIPINVSGLNFSAATNLNGIASDITTGLGAAATCTWNSTYGQFTIKSASTGTSSSVGYASAPTAIGSATFSANPAASDTLTVDGTAITFVATGATGNQVNIGATLSATLTSLAALINGSTDVNLVKVTAYVAGSVLYLVSKATGTTGDVYTLAKTSTAITVSGATFTGGSGTDISAMLGMTSTLASAPVAGIAAEQPSDALGIFVNKFGRQFVAVEFADTSITDTQLIAVSAATEADQNHFHAITTQEASVLDSTSTTDIAYLLQQLAYKYTVVQYSSTSPYAVASLMGRILTTDFNANNSTIILDFKGEPGIVPEYLTDTQFQALKAKNCVVFTEMDNNTAIIRNSVTPSGLYFDSVYNALWFKDEIQNDVYNLMYTSPTKIPQTDPGMHLIQTVIEAACAKAVNNGYLAPGVWNSQGFGTLNQGDFLPKGYYVYAPPVATQNAADRQARKTVTFQVAGKEAGGVVDVAISVNVDR